MSLRVASAKVSGIVVTDEFGVGATIGMDVCFTLSNSSTVPAGALGCGKGVVTRVLS